MIEDKMNQRKFDLEKLEKERIERIKEEERKQKAYKEKMDQTDETAEYGEINLSFFKRISRSSQFLIACGFIAIIFSGLYLCLFSLNKKENKSTKKRK